jgi:ribonucleoside-diphosphate reductase alpha chain
MPKESTIDEIMQVYVDGWKLGLKAVAIYRDGSKRTQPLNVTRDGKEAKPAAVAVAAPAQVQVVAGPHRRRMAVTGSSLRHKFDVAGHEGYLHVGLYDDGAPGELFITMAKEGSTVGGMMDAFATAVSLCLQYGVPLESLVKKFSHQRFEPSGMTTNRDIPFAKSIVDYVFRWLGLTFLEEFRKANMPNRAPEALPKKAPEAAKDDTTSEPGRVDKPSRTEAPGAVGALYTSDGGNGQSGDGGRKQALAIATETGGRLQTREDGLDTGFKHFQEDAPACGVCGSLMVRSGSCYKCHVCGSSSGCS